MFNIKSGGQGARAGAQRYQPQELFRSGAGFRSSTVLMMTLFFDFLLFRWGA